MFLILTPFVLILPAQAFAQRDVITLESQVKGNQEQPNVLSIVPWKFADDVSQLDQGIEADISRLFQHLDRDEFARQQYFHKHFLQVKQSAKAE